MLKSQEIQNEANQNMVHHTNQLNLENQNFRKEVETLGRQNAELKQQIDKDRPKSIEADKKLDFKIKLPT